MSKKLEKQDIEKALRELDAVIEKAEAKDRDTGFKLTRAEALVQDAADVAKAVEQAREAKIEKEDTARVLGVLHQRRVGVQAQLKEIEQQELEAAEAAAAAALEATAAEAHPQLLAIAEQVKAVYSKVFDARDAHEAAAALAGRRTPPARDGALAELMVSAVYDSVPNRRSNLNPAASLASFAKRIADKPRELAEQEEQHRRARVQDEATQLAQDMVSNDPGRRAAAEKRQRGLVANFYRNRPVAVVEEQTPTGRRVSALNPDDLPAQAALAISTPEKE